MLLRDERGRTDKSVKETEVLLQKALKLQRETDDEARGWLLGVLGAVATRVRGCQGLSGAVRGRCHTC